MKAWVAYPIDSMQSHDLHGGHVELTEDFFADADPISKQFGVYGLPHVAESQTFRINQLLGPVNTHAEVFDAIRYRIDSEVDVLMLAFEFDSSNARGAGSLDDLRRVGTQKVNSVVSKAGLALDRRLARFGVALVDTEECELLGSGTQVHLLAPQSNDFVTNDLAQHMVVAVAVERQLLDNATLALRDKKMSSRKARKTLNHLLSWHSVPALDDNSVQQLFEQMRAALRLNERSAQIQQNLTTIGQRSQTVLVAGFTLSGLLVAVATLDLIPWWGRLCSLGGAALIFGIGLAMARGR